MTNLIYTSDEETKNKLVEYGFPLLKSDNGIFVFANINQNEVAKLNFDSKKIAFSNKMTF